MKFSYGRYASNRPCRYESALKISVAMIFVGE